MNPVDIINELQKLGSVWESVAFVCTTVAGLAYFAAKWRFDGIIDQLKHRLELRDDEIKKLERERADDRSKPAAPAGRPSSMASTGESAVSGISKGNYAMNQAEVASLRHLIKNIVETIEDNDTSAKAVALMDHYISELRASKQSVWLENGPRQARRDFVQRYRAIRNVYDITSLAQNNSKPAFFADANDRSEGLAEMKIAADRLDRALTTGRIDD